MSQVKIKQMPVTSQQMAGSWFPSGYYGHFRAKPRADLSNHFRQLARPNPPKKFLFRQNSEATAHLFSQHDNRFKFENDPLVRGTQSGFGKRRSEINNRGAFDPFFIGWIPEKANRKTYIDDIKTTCYANDYNGIFTPSQILSDIQSINSLPSSEASVYSSVYNHGQPDEQQSKQIRQETFGRYSATQTRRSKLQRSEGSFNVASCLVWNNTGKENEHTKMNDDMKNILAPITLKSRNNLHDMPIINQQKPYRSQSLQTLNRMEQPGFDATTLRERFNVKKIPSIRAASSLEQIRTNSVEDLISKYM